ncbi:MAG: S-formylglutathione hydrolase [Oligoflexales bacterium]|nr:S-formylglutathione hydrolase [Oligoflexales bacterium]
MQLRHRYKSYAGWVEFYQHASTATQSPMRFSVYRPEGTGPFPVLYWLSGLSCTEENFMQKSGVQRYLSQHKILCVAMDTSPRSLGLASETARWDLGAGAGFYVNASQEPWAKNYRMYDYVSSELYELIPREFPADKNRQSIFGHSMGGHGALVIGLRNPSKFRSMSAFAPICAPMQCPWGQGAFNAYLGQDTKAWSDYDASQLIQKADRPIPLLVDQGSEDEFLEAQLKPELLTSACLKKDYPIDFTSHPGYDHSYYFVASFMEKHIAFHRKFLER